MKLFTALKLLTRIVRGGEDSDYARYLFAEKLTHVLHPQTRFSEYGRSFLDDHDFQALYHKLEPANTRSLDRKFTLVELMKLTASVAGDTAECGVFRGASSYLICRENRRRGQGQVHHVFDSFEGLSVPGQHDGASWESGNMSAGLEVVRRTLSEFEHVEYHPGWIPKRFAEVEQRRFAFVHIDVDLYQPTLDSVTFFYPRLSPGGILLCDDYGFRSCPGARRALDEFFAETEEKVVHLPTGQGFVQKAVAAPLSPDPTPVGGLRPSPGAAGSPA